MGGGGMVRDICQAKWCVAWGGRPRLDRKMVAYVEVKNQKQTKKPCMSRQSARSQPPLLLWENASVPRPPRSLRPVGA